MIIVWHGFCATNVIADLHDTIYTLEGPISMLSQLWWTNVRSGHYTNAVGI